MRGAKILDEWILYSVLKPLYDYKTTHLMLHVAIVIYSIHDYLIPFILM
jgi:hypothetical protein